MSDHRQHAIGLLGYAAIGFVLALAVMGAGCATLKTCAKPVEAQAIQDAAGVLVCANTGKTLADCESAQLAVEAGQLTSDALVCAELAVANAANGTHTAGK